jgi:hypothetical protein
MLFFGPDFVSATNGLTLCHAEEHYDWQEAGNGYPALYFTLESLVKLCALD